jgi:RNA polymerase sigma-70 factor, ECF subfamily
MAATKTLELLSFDAAYLRALHKADPETERHFVSYFTPLIQRKLRKYLHVPDLIQEGVQETLVRVVITVRSRNGVRYPERFGAFVHAVCRNVAMEIFRREKRFLDLEEAGPVAESGSRSPHSAAEARETRDRVRRILNNLSKFDRELLEALFLAEEERSTLCRRFGVSDGYLRVLLHRAKQRFIGQLSREAPEAYAAAANAGAPARSRTTRTLAVPELRTAHIL